MVKAKPKTDNRFEIWRARARRLARALADTPLPEVLFISTFILIRWWNNSDFSYPSEILLPVIAFGLLASAIFYIYRWVFGPGLAAHLAALALSYLFYVFQFIENARFGRAVYDLLPSFLSSAFTRSLVLALIIGVLCGAAAWAFERLSNRFKLLRQLQLYKVILFAVAFVFVLQLVRTGGRLFELRHQLGYKYQAAAMPAANKQAVSAKPDIYYLVFDRYTNQNVLTQNFNFDNSEMVGFLDQQGFVTRENAYSNYAFTMSSVSSTMAMNYFPEFERKFGRDGRWQSAAPYRSIFNDPPIANVLADQGYQYNHVSSWWDFTRVGIKADKHYAQSYRLNVFNKSFYATDLQRDIFFKSILSPWLKKGISFGDWPVLKYDLDRNPVENFNSQIDSLKAISARSDKNTPQFTLAHVLAPHPPYVFDQNGNTPPYDVESNDNGVDEQVKYANELIYVNKRLKDLIAHIRQTSPDAVVIVQADEGPYPKQFRGPMSPERYYDPLELPQKQMQQKFGILASYYMPGVERGEVEKINSSVNVFRFVLNHYLGYNMQMLPDCQLSSGNKFNVYNYTVVNDRLTGKALPAACRQFE